MRTDRRTMVRGLLAVLALADLVLLALLMAPDTPPRTSPEREVFQTLDRDGLAQALSELRRAAAADSAVLRDGHQLAHTLGRRAVATMGDASVIKDCRPDFASGCYHGVVEAFIQQTRGSVDMPALERMCAAAGSEERPGPVTECVHGLGHGLLGATGMNVEQALRHCDGLSRTEARAGCHAGVFMEAIASSFRGAPMDEKRGVGENHHAGSPPMHHAIVTESGDPYAPCSRYDDPYADSCWLFQGFVILRRVDFDVAAAMQLCDAGPPSRVARCYESIGHQVTGLFQRDDPWIVNQCKSGRAELGPRCATGAVLALTAMDWSGKRALKFCRSVLDTWKDDCYGELVRSVDALASRTERGVICGQIEADLMRPCGLKGS